MEITTLGVFAGFMTVLWGIGMRMLYSEISHAVEKINMRTPEISITGEIKQELYDLMSIALDDTVGNIQMPSAWDHTIGAISQFMQHKFANSLPNLNVPGMMSDQHGQETNQEEDTPFTQ